MEGTKGIMATTLGFIAASGIRDGWLWLPSTSQPKEFTAFDQERLDKAEAKRERKAAKLLAQGRL